MAIAQRSWLPWVAAALLLAAAPGVLGQACTANTQCANGLCCNTLVASREPGNGASVHAIAFSPRR